MFHQKKGREDEGVDEKEKPRTRAMCVERF